MLVLSFHRCICFSYRSYISLFIALWIQWFWFFPGVTTFPWYVHKGHMLTCGNLFSLSYKWVLGIGLWSSDLVANAFPDEPSCWLGSLPFFFSYSLYFALDSYHVLVQLFSSKHQQMSLLPCSLSKADCSFHLAWITLSMVHQVMNPENAELLSDITHGLSSCAKSLAYNSNTMNNSLCCFDFPFNHLVI